MPFGRGEHRDPRVDARRRLDGDRLRDGHAPIRARIEHDHLAAVVIVCASAAPKDRQGSAIEQGFRALPVVATKVRCTAAWAGSRLRHNNSRSAAAGATRRRMNIESPVVDASAAPPMARLQSTRGSQCGGAGDPDSARSRSRMASPDLLSDAQSVLFSRAPDSAPVADQRNVFPSSRSARRSAGGATMRSRRIR